MDDELSSKRYMDSPGEVTSHGSGSAMYLMGKGHTGRLWDVQVPVGILRLLYFTYIVGLL